MKFSIPLFITAWLLAWPTTASAQVVQLPTTGSFSLSTSVAVPDSGGVYLGGNASSRAGSSSRGMGLGTSAIGSSTTGGGVSVHATVIDLDELDRMIRSQSGAITYDPKLNPFNPKAPPRVATAPRSQVVTPAYEYLATLSGHGNKVELPDPDAIKYYLTLAHAAQQKGNWASVKLYYMLAWNELPPARREAALAALASARAPDESSVKNLRPTSARGTSSSRTPR